MACRVRARRQDTINIWTPMNTVELLMVNQETRAEETTLTPSSSEIHKKHEDSQECIVTSVACVHTTRMN